MATRQGYSTVPMPGQTGNPPAAGGYPAMPATGPGSTPAPQQQAQQPHPTVPYGQGGIPLYTVIPPNQPLPGQQQPPAAPQGQAPQFYGAGYDPNLLPPAPGQATQPGAQPGYYATPQSQPGQPQYQAQPVAQPQPPQPAGIPANAILEGPGVPPELRGRTFQQAMQLYSGLTQAWVRSQAAGGQQPQPQMQQPQMQQPQQPQQPRAPGFWEDARSIIREELNSILPQAIGPVVQHVTTQGISAAHASARASIPDFAMLEADVMSSLTGAPPESLANPDVWAAAADLARGKAIREGRYQQQVPQPQPQPGQYGQPQQPQPMRSVPAGMMPLPQYTFFSEGPTPPVNGQGANGNFGLSGQEMWAASAMGMRPEEYAAWKGGVQRQ